MLSEISLIWEMSVYESIHPAVAFQYQLLALRIAYDDFHLPPRRVSGRNSETTYRGGRFQCGAALFTMRVFSAADELRTAIKE
jgi:hypothetical protein